MFVLAEGDKKSSCLQYQTEGAVCLVQTFYQSCVHTINLSHVPKICKLRFYNSYLNWQESNRLCKYLTILSLSLPGNASQGCVPTS